MGKCVSREATWPSPAHHQSVLTITLSQQDLAHAHKIWQQLTASNEYIAATAPADESSVYYHISRTGEQLDLQTEVKTETAEVEDRQGHGLSEDATDVLHIQSLYNQFDSHVDANVIGSFLADKNRSNNNNNNNNGDVDDKYTTCQDFLLQELMQELKNCQVKTIAPCQCGLRPTNCQLVECNAALEQEFPVQKKGQAESKKHGKTSRQKLDTAEQQLHTKGTAMSFGFRKKLNGTPKKLKKRLDSATERTVTQADTKDDNGNDAAPVKFEKVGVAAQNRTAAADRRFGYRGAPPPRPASAGLTSTPAEESTANAQNNNNNNNMSNNSSNSDNNNGSTTGNVLVSNLKRRSKSAHAGRTNDTEPKIAQPKTLTFNLNQNTTIEYQRRQFFGEIADEATSRPQTQPQQGYSYKNLANMHANVIARSTPRDMPPSFAKFTLQTVSLPRPEYPVAISLSATTPTTPNSSVQSPVPAHATGARAKDISTVARHHPLTSIHAQPSRQLDQKSVKQLTNNSTRRGFSGSREISADSGIASLDMAMDSGSSSGSSASHSKRSRSRPRNLQMVMSGRHTFQVRDADDPPSSESNSFVEPLALPKLPTDNSQTMPLPLVGLVRSNTVLSRENYERRQTSKAPLKDAAVEIKPKNSGSDDSESVDEEKLYLDSSTSEKSAKQQICSQSSSMSWSCQAGESLAHRECSSMSITSSDPQAQDRSNDKEEDNTLALDDISLINANMQLSPISSMTEPTPKSGFPANREFLLSATFADNSNAPPVQAASERPCSFNNALNESKFAELALANSTCLLLDDETSPTDSLVSSTEESEEAGGKLKKHRLNAELQQKDIDVDIEDISPVLDLELDSGSRSPLSPGTPTHASQSLSLVSDCGNLIDDEIADQPALLCNSEVQELANDTPTLMETHSHTQADSMRSLKSQSRARTALQQAIELSLRTPAAVRRAVLESAESLDTLSPCESICSDDLMMDFDINSSVDSIDHAASLRHSRSGSDLHKLCADQAETEAELFSQLACKGSAVMKELDNLSRNRMQRSAPSPRERISAKLPARAIRLLNRSRLQDQQQLAGNDSDNSLRSTHSGASSRKRSTAASRTSTGSSTSSLQRRHQQQQQQFCATASGSKRTPGLAIKAELHSSSDDLMLYDKSFRNAMIQDVLQFKKQLLRLRRILQEEADINLRRTETLNPFENDNVQLFAACGLDSKLLNDIDLASLTSSTTEDPLQELSDLRRQVVYLQGQVDDRDRTIRLQRDLIEQLEAEKRQASGGDSSSNSVNKERISMATQTERTRPLAIGAEGLSRSKPEYTSYTTHFPTLHVHCNDSTVAATTVIRQQPQPQLPQPSQYSQQTSTGQQKAQSSPSDCRALSHTRRHTIISTTLTNYNQQLAATAYPRRASIGWDSAEATTPVPAAPAVHKPVRITLIGETLPVPNEGCHKLLQRQLPPQNGAKAHFLNGCQSSVNASSSNNQGNHYQPLYNSNKMANPTVTIV